MKIYLHQKHTIVFISLRKLFYGFVVVSPPHILNIFFNRMLNDVPEKIQIITRTRNPFKELLHKSHTIGYVNKLSFKIHTRENIQKTSILKATVNLMKPILRNW